MDFIGDAVLFIFSLIYIVPAAVLLTVNAYTVTEVWVLQKKF